MRRATRSMLRFALLLGAACSSCGPLDAVEFRCERDEQCTQSSDQGVCQESGYCAFSDSSCTSGYRYAELASAERRDRCVEVCASELSLGSQHTCVILKGGAVRCWGAQDRGQLGPNASGEDYSLLPVPVSLDEPAVALSSGGPHTCAVLESGRLTCWGGDYDDAATQAQLASASLRIAEVAVGVGHTCVRLDGRALCWGLNNQGQLGARTSVGESPRVTVPIRSDGGLLQVAVGGVHSCALERGGRMWCWGGNQSGQLGPTSTETTDVPPTVTLRDAVEAMSLGASHSCALMAGEVRCWGGNTFNQIGSGLSERAPSEPFLVPLESSVRSVSSGERHNCVVTAARDVWCWGSHVNLQLGPTAGRDVLQSSPVSVPLPTSIDRVWASTTHSCALSEEGMIYCWGGNESGQLGNQATLDQSEPDETVNRFLECPEAR